MSTTLMSWKIRLSRFRVASHSHGRTVKRQNTRRSSSPVQVTPVTRPVIVRWPAPTLPKPLSPGMPGMNVPRPSNSIVTLTS